MNLAEPTFWIQLGSTGLLAYVVWRELRDLRLSMVAQMGLLYERLGRLRGREDLTPVHDQTPPRPYATPAPSRPRSTLPRP